RLPRWQLVEFLEYDDAVRAWFAHLVAVQADATGNRLDEAGDRLEQRGFAATGRPEQHETIGAVHLEADFVGGAHHALRGAVFEADLLHLQQGVEGRFILVAGRVALHKGVHGLQLPWPMAASSKK